MTDEKQASVIEKIRKLFQMGQRTRGNDGVSNESEAESAMKLAQTLLAKYNLNLSVIQDSEKKAEAQGTTGKRERINIHRSAMYNWQRYLWRNLAEANFCFHWVTRVTEFRWGKDREVKRHVILGSEVNVAVVQAMGEYLTETIERLVLTHYTKAESLSRSANSWREGCAVRLVDRIQERAAKMRREGFNEDGVSCTALAVQDVHEKEYAANYDDRYGVGAYARMKADHVKWEAKAKEREQEAAAARARTLAGETPEQRKQRERDEAKVAAKQAAKNAKDWARYQRRAEKKAARRDLVAYARGTKAANSINLDSQLGGK